MENRKTIVLSEFKEEDYLIPGYVTDDWKSSNQDKIATALILDTETTGVFHYQDQVIELGMVLFKYNKEDGALVEVVHSYGSFNECTVPLPKFVSQLTGIDKSDLVGQSIDWTAANALLEKADLVIAHNAKFDRSFIDDLSLVSKSKIWGCSMSQIDWMEKGFRTKGLELLSQRHGFFVGSHRALADTQATLHLITHTDKSTGKTYLHELIENTKLAQVLLEATRAPFESKDLLKSRQYRWNPQKRVWAKLLSEKELDSEKDWLKKEVYPNLSENPATGYKLALKDVFKSD